MTNKQHDSDFTIFARIKPKAKHYDNVKHALLGILKPTLEEPDCYEFRVFEGDPYDGHIYFYERFKNKEALDFHLKQDYVTSVMHQYDEWLEAPKTFYTTREFEAQPA